jgi:hypothetical protein
MTDWRQRVTFSETIGAAAHLSLAAGFPGALALLGLAWLWSAAGRLLVRQA